MTLDARLPHGHAGKPSLSAALARAVASVSADELGPETWTAAQSHLLDCLTLIIAGHGSARVQRAVNTRGARDETFALSLACGALGLDDFDEGTRAHPGAMLVPALMVAAANRHEPVTGRQFVVALLAGYETVAWLGAAMDARHMHPQGRHPSAVLGVPAVAVAVARLFGPAEDRIQAAVGIGAGLACGLTAFDAEEDMRAVQTAWAASAGLRAAQLADAGFRSSPHALEGAGGLLRGVTSAVPPTAGIAKAPFAVESVSFKPYSHFSDLHPLTDALFDAVGGRRISQNDIAAVRVHLTPTAASRLHHGLAPRSPKEAKRCAEFVVAACLLGNDGSGAPNPAVTLDTSRIADPVVLSLAERVAVIPDLGAEPTGPDSEQSSARQIVARVAIILTSGEVCNGVSAGYPGDGRDPALRWTLDDVGERFDALTATAKGPARVAAQAILPLAMKLSSVQDVREPARVIAALPFRAC